MLEVLKWRLREWSTHGEPARWVSLARELSGRVAHFLGKHATALAHGSAAARLRGSARSRARVESWLSRLAGEITERNRDALLDRIAIPGNRITKGVILKAPGERGERGVLYVAAEGHWARLAQSAGPPLADEYALVIAPSWSLPHAPVHYLFPAWYGSPITVQLSNREDSTVFSGMSPYYRPIGLFASSWVDHRLYRPGPAQERKTDLLMVANFHHFKRHYAFFRALRHLPRSWRVVLVGQPERGRTARDIQREARSVGVEGRFELFTDVDYADIPAFFEDARASIVLSRREGSCVVVAESLFAGTPVGLLEDAWIGSREFINSATGRLLRSHHLAADIRELVESFETFTPRDWAQANIHYERSTAVLNAALRQVERDLGRPWTRDILPMVWRPYPQLADPNHELEQATEAFRKKYGIAIGRDN